MKRRIVIFFLRFQLTRGLESRDAWTCIELNRSLRTHLDIASVMLLVCSVTSHDISTCWFLTLDPEVVNKSAYTYALLVLWKVISGTKRTDDRFLALCISLRPQSLEDKLTSED